MLDASRSVTVVGSLLGDDKVGRALVGLTPHQHAVIIIPPAPTSPSLDGPPPPAKRPGFQSVSQRLHSCAPPYHQAEYIQDVLDEYEELREEHYAGLEERAMKTLDQPKRLGCHIDFAERPPAPMPNQLGLTTIDYYSLEDVVPYIDWNPFFQTWELRGKYPNRGYPRIFNDESVGAEAKKLFDDAQVGKEGREAGGGRGREERQREGGSRLTQFVLGLFDGLPRYRRC